MGRNKGAGKSLAEAVRAEINTLPHVKSCLSEGIVNYSALSRRLIQPLSGKLNRDLNEESLIVSIKRYADEIRDSVIEHSHLETFAGSEIIMQDNVCYLCFRRTPELVSRIEALFDRVDWGIGERRFLIQGPDQIMVLTKWSRVKDLKEEFGEDLLYSLDNNVLVSFRIPLESFNIYGLLSEITLMLAK